MMCQTLQCLFGLWNCVMMCQTLQCLFGLWNCGMMWPNIAMFVWTVKLRNDVSNIAMFVWTVKLWNDADKHCNIFWTFKLCWMIWSNGTVECLFVLWSCVVWSKYWTHRTMKCFVLWICLEWSKNWTEHTEQWNVCLCCESVWNGQCTEHTEQRNVCLFCDSVSASSIGILFLMDVYPWKLHALGKSFISAASEYLQMDVLIKYVCLVRQWWTITSRTEGEKYSSAILGAITHERQHILHEKNSNKASPYVRKANSPSCSRLTSKRWRQWESQHVYSTKLIGLTIRST